MRNKRVHYFTVVWGQTGANCNEFSGWHWDQARSQETMSSIYSLDATGHQTSSNYITTCLLHHRYSGVESFHYIIVKRQRFRNSKANPKTLKNVTSDLVLALSPGRWERDREHCTSSKENTLDPCFVSVQRASHSELIQPNNLKLNTWRQWLSL